MPFGITRDWRPMLNGSPHGSEIMDLGMQSLARAGIVTHDDYERRIAEFLRERGTCASAAEAAETAFLITMAAKGLLYKSDSTAEFEAGMQRVVKAAPPGL